MRFLVFVVGHDYFITRFALNQACTNNIHLNGSIPHCGGWIAQPSTSRSKESDERHLQNSTRCAVCQDALRARGCAVTCVELDVRLAEFLRKKRHKVFQQDFLVFNEGGSFYNRVIMNPPFGNLQELDHVYHAYDLLLPGGILVAILPESPFFQEDKKAASFRQWLEERDADIEELLAGAFHDSGTEVKTRIVTVKKHA